jgi:hypothetical protein
MGSRWVISLFEIIKRFGINPVMFGIDLRLRIRIQHQRYPSMHMKAHPILLGNESVLY